MNTTRQERIIVNFDSSSCTGYLEKSSESEELFQRWFGWYSGNKLVLNLVEVSYLLSTGRIAVKSESEDLIDNLDVLVSRHPHCFEKFFWPMLTVFKDLRDRGRKVRIIDKMKFLVKDKSGNMRLIYILEERSPIGIDSITELVNVSRRNNLKATLAIVSLHGELTYYEVTQADFKVE